MKTKSPRYQEDYLGQYKDIERDPGHRLQYERPLLAGIFVLLDVCLVVALVYLVVAVLLH